MAAQRNYKNTGAYLRELYDSLVVNLHQHLAEEGYGEISPSHGLVFQYLEEGGSRITTLAARGGMTKQSMSALVYQLEEYGYLKRKGDPEDARAVLFYLTTKGQALRTKAQSLNYQFEEKWKQTLGPEQYKKLREMIQKLAEAEAPDSRGEAD
ncbi:MAG TPA: MarR family winged helix-turn-helix transcriptional regulator [Chryseolinea sp.]|nr:MarR family winged helix-turn-helix transcriptional regulator [Chryseolinea sp.]